MENIEITKENYSGYKQLFNSKIGFLPNDKTLKKKNNTFCITSWLLMCGLGMLTTYWLCSLTTDIIQAMIILIGSSTTVISTSIVTNVGHRKIIGKYLKDKYPYLNLDVGIDELNEKLEKYETLVKIPKNIEKQKEEYISNVQNNDFNNLTSREQIELLEKTKEIIIQSQTKQELTEENQKENEVKYQKKIGSITK